MESIEMAVLRTTESVRDDLALARENSLRWNRFTEEQRAHLRRVERFFEAHLHRHKLVTLYETTHRQLTRADWGGANPEHYGELNGYIYRDGTYQDCHEYGHSLFQEMYNAAKCEGISFAEAAFRYWPYDVHRESPFWRRKREHRIEPYELLKVHEQATSLICIAGPLFEYTPAQLRTSLTLILHHPRTRLRFTP